MGESLPRETPSMKLFSAFLLSLSTVSAEWTCDECAEMSAFMALTASDPAFIERWNELLVIDICPLTTVADTCPITLPWLWTAMAPPLFADYFSYICADLEECQVTNKRVIGETSVPSCAECTSYLPRAFFNFQGPFLLINI